MFDAVLVPWVASVLFSFIYTEPSVAVGLSLSSPKTKILISAVSVAVPSVKV